VLLVGGSTRMPAVPRMMRRLLGSPLERSVVPEDAVALGAALYDPGFGIREVASHGLGVLARSARTGALRNLTIVPAGATLPAARSAVLTTGEDGQKRLVVDVTLGDGTDPSTVRMVHREVIAVPTGHSGTRIEVRCGYDSAEVPRVEVGEVTGNRLLSRFAVQSRGAMSEVDLGDAARRVTSPRWY
jgi:molecular chaperone DnaK